MATYWYFVTKSSLNFQLFKAIAIVRKKHCPWSNIHTYQVPKGVIILGRLVGI
jgi:hypothetical protein